MERNQRSRSTGTRTVIEACFKHAPPQAIASHIEHDKGHGRIERREANVIPDVDWRRAMIASPANSACRPCPAWPRSRPTSNEPVRRIVRGATTSPPTPSMRPALPTPCAAIGHREHPALGPRRNVQGGSVPPRQGLRRPQHGRHTPFCAEPRARRSRSKIPQAQPQARRMGHSLSQPTTRRSGELNSDSWPCWRSRSPKQIEIASAASHSIGR